MLVLSQELSVCRTATAYWGNYTVYNKGCRYSKLYIQKNKNQAEFLPHIKKIPCQQNQSEILL